MCVCLFTYENNIYIYYILHLYSINYLRNVIMIDSGWNPTTLEDTRTMFADQVRFLEWSNDSHTLDKTSVTQDSYCSITFIVQFISCVTFTVCEI